MQIFAKDELFLLWFLLPSAFQRCSKLHDELKGEEILEQQSSGFGQYAFRMELYAFNRELAVPQAHDDALAVGIMRFRADLQLFGQSFFGDDERVISRGGHWQRRVFKNSPAVMRDLADFAMHDLAGAHDVTAERGADGLVPQTDAENRALTGEVLDEINADASLMRCARPRRDQDVIRPEALDFLRGDLVIAADLHFFTQFTKILDQVVSEGIVIVEDENHGDCLQFI